MRNVLLGVSFASLIAIAASAQVAPTPVGQTFSSSGDVAAAMAKAIAIKKPGSASIVPILNLAPYTVQVDYRTETGGPNLHKHFAEFVYVMGGSGALIMGGKLVDPTPSGADDLKGTAIAGGGAQPMAKGDVFVIPEGTPHQFDTKGGKLQLVALHAPHPTPGWPTPPPTAPAGADRIFFHSSADLSAPMASAKGLAETAANKVGTVQIMTLAPYHLDLEYRIAQAPAALHERDAEFVYVLQGSGAITTGGKLANGARTNVSNLSGPSISGGDTRKLAKGDVLAIPENTPHQFSPAGGPLVLLTLHLPRPAPAAPG